MSEKEKKPISYRDIAKAVLPDPGFSKVEGLAGRESSSWLQYDDTLMSLFVMFHSSMAGQYRKQTDDLTFIIPFALDDRTRWTGFCATIAWIMSTTTAKVIITLSETERSWKRWYNEKNISKDEFITWEQFSDPLFPEWKKKNHLIRMLQFHTCYKFYDSKALQAKFKLSAWENKQFRNELNKRIELIPISRNHGEPFHRTRYLNMMLDRVTTPFVCNHDADTILSSHGVMTALSFLRFNTAQAVYPYQRSIDAQKRVFYTDSPAGSPLGSLVMTGDMSSFLHEAHGVMSWPASYGQSIFFKTASYKAIGGENENFVSWAPEDVERYSRAIKMGLTVARVQAPIVHIEHRRGPDSSTMNKKFQSNEELYNKILAMSLPELKEYYSNAAYLSKYKW